MTPTRGQDIKALPGRETGLPPAGLLLQLPECFLLSPVARHHLLHLLLLLAGPDCLEEDPAETEAPPA